MVNIYTLGHSTRNFKDFINILLDYDIGCLVDVRSLPGSRKYPQFNKEYLETNLEQYGIEYYHIPELGGRRRKISPLDKSIDSSSFAAYANYMRTPEFKRGLRELKKIGRNCKTVYICSEAVWWNCHRRMISDRLTFDGWKVYHLGIGNKDPVLHKIWDIARLNKQGEIIYDK